MFKLVSSFCCDTHSFNWSHRHKDFPIHDPILFSAQTLFIPILWWSYSPVIPCFDLTIVCSAFLLLLVLALPRVRETRAAVWPWIPGLSLVFKSGTIFFYLFFLVSGLPWHSCLSDNIICNLSSFFNF